MKQDPNDPTGVRDEPGGKGGSDLVRARNRKANAALQLHIAGLTKDEIAETVGYPDGGAVQVAIELALERELHEDSRDAMRRMAGLRLQRLTKAVWAKAINAKAPEQLAAQREARANIGEFVRLYGLAAPTEMVVHTPTATELENWVSAVVSKQVPELEEADIFEGEIIVDSHDPVIVETTGGGSETSRRPPPVEDPYLYVNDF